MIIAGLGFRLHTPMSSLYEILNQINVEHDIQVDAFAVINEKLPLVSFISMKYDLPIIGVDECLLKNVITPTQSTYSLREKGVGSVAESVALVAAGKDSKLLYTRIISADRMATCAVAYGKSAQKKRNKR